MLKDMEQKKLLWIVAAVGVFLLVVIGTALILYSPSKNEGTVITSLNQPLASTSTAQADPDAWVRNPDTTPEFNTNTNQSASISDYMIVSGNTTVISDKTTIDLIGVKPNNATESIPLTDLLPSDKKQESVSPAPALTLTPSAPKTSVTAAKPETTSKPAPAKVTSTAKSQTVPASIEYWVQAASFSSKTNAEKARTVLTKNKINSEIFTATVNGATHYRVRVGPYKTKSEAEYWLGFIKENPEFTGSYVTEVKPRQ